MKLITILLLGISMQYNVAFTSENNNVSVSEALDINVPEEVISSSGMSADDYVRKLETDYFKALDVTGYTINKTEENGDLILRFRKTFDNPYLYASETIFTDQLFGKPSVSDYDGTEFNLSYANFYNANQNAFTTQSGNFAFIITLPYSVTGSNATSNSNGTYTWTINGSSLGQSIAFNTTAIASPTPADTATSIWDTFPIKFNFTTVFLIIIIGGLGGLALYMLMMHQKNNSI